MKRKLFCLFLVFLFTLGIFGCDIKEDFSEEETNELFQELKEDFSNPDIWKGSKTTNHPFGNTSQTVVFIRTAMELWNREDADQSIFAYWFDSKTYCRICVLNCNCSIVYASKSYFIEDVSVAKYKDNSYLISVTYKDDPDDQDSHYTEITLR